MRKFLAGVGVLLGLTLAAASARAQYYGPPVPPYPINQPVPYCGPYISPAPDFNHPACVGYDAWGRPVVGVYPPFGPWAGALPPPSNGNGNGGMFPTHAFARSPRDYFMWYEREQEYTPYNRIR
jgi:hypothetical protein